MTPPRCWFGAARLASARAREARKRGDHQAAATLDAFAAELRARGEGEPTVAIRIPTCPHCGRALPPQLAR